MTPPIFTPQAIHQLRETLVTALGRGTTVREATAEARGYARAIAPALPATVIDRIVEDLLAEIDPWLPHLKAVEIDARPNPPGQFSLRL